MSYELHLIDDQSPGPTFRQTASTIEEAKAATDELDKPAPGAEYRIIEHAGHRHRVVSTGYWLTDLGGFYHMFWKDTVPTRKVDVEFKHDTTEGVLHVEVNGRQIGPFGIDEENDDVMAKMEGAVADAVLVAGFYPETGA